MIKATLTLVTLLLFATPSAIAEIKLQPVFSNLTFNQPVLLTHANDQSNRLFVVEQGGTIKSFLNTPSTNTSTTFFDIEQATENRLLTGGEQGLLGLAFDPEFSSNGYFYINYTAASPRRTVIARYQTNEKGQQVNYGSETILLEIAQDFANHNGGMLAFGPDNYLYIGMGDGGSGGDPKNRAQDLNSLLGKMLRIDRNGNAATDNPFIDSPNAKDEIWALGLRNPWRFSFDRTTGKLWAGDVGQGKLEEISVIEKGGNYGWPWFEGTQRYNKGSLPSNAQFIEPIHEYGRSDGRSITGGYVYRGKQFPALDGWYFFGDFVASNLWMLNSDTGKVKSLPSVRNPAAFGEDADGELYVVSYLGKLYRIEDE